MELQQEEKKALSFFRIKTEWIAANELGALDKTKTEELVVAANYSDAEKTAYELVHDQNRYEFGDVNIEIIKTKIEDVQFNDVLQQEDSLVNGLICNYFSADAESGEGLYAVKVVFFITNDKTGRTKNITENIYMPATSNSDAANRVRKMFGNRNDYAIRDVKFDNAVAIYWTPEMHESKTKAFDMQ